MAESNTGVPTNRSSIILPAEISQEILQKTQDASAVMSLARRVDLPGRGLEIPVILGDPEAAWTSETGMKPVSNPSLTKKTMTAWKLSVIVPFSNEFRRDAASLYDELVRRLPAALAKKFDATVFGAYPAPGTGFDTFAASGSVVLNDTSEFPTIYQGMVAADAEIAEAGGIMNGIVLSPQGKSVLLGATDDNGRPLFINNVAEGAVPMVLGAKTVLDKAAYYEGDSSNVIGVAGDWTQALYGTVEGVKIDYSSDATLTSGNETINLFQQNMFAVRCEVEVGFVADTTSFVKLAASTN